MKTNLFTKFAFAFSMLFALSFAKAQNPACPTDFNKDGITNATDYAIFGPQYGTTCSATPCITDLNGDGVTNVNDFLIFGAQYGKRCNVIIYSISTATFSNGYVNIPVSISSDATITSWDIELKFNENILTFDSVIYVPLATNMPLYYFNTNDRFLRSTSNILTSYPNDTSLAWIRFATSQTTLSITDANFNTLKANLNGNSVGSIVK